MEQADSNLPIKSKSAYFKILFLKDKEKFKNEPILRKPLRNSNELVPIYDIGVAYFFTLYGIKSPSRYNWSFTSSEGTIDDVLQLYPFDYTKYDADPSKRNNLRVWDKIMIPKTDGVVVVAHYYNAFQKENGEWAGIRAEKDVAELRLVLDFSSIITILGKENLLFKDSPKASLVDPVEETSRVVKTEYSSGRIFSAAANNVPEGSVLQFNWKLNWENLAVWKASAYDQEIIPTISFDAFQEAL